MRLETFTGTALHRVLLEARQSLGDDAMVVRTRHFKEHGEARIEIVAARADEVESLRRRLDGGRAAAANARKRERVGPYRVALVGPAGAGKTTSLIKLALHPRGVAQKKVGLITLDTHRVAGLEEIQTFAEITNLPLEVIYHSREVEDAVKRLRGCDVILIDCPGRAPSLDAPAEWELALEKLDPDEVHLVLSAGVRHDIAHAARRNWSDCGITHVLYTMLDQLPDDMGLAQIAEAVGLPTRWLSDGHEIPADLKEAGPRILSALGLGEDEGEFARTA